MPPRGPHGLHGADEARGLHGLHRLHGRGPRGPAGPPYAVALPRRPQVPDLHEELRHIIALLRIMGAWPIRHARHGKGYVPLRWCSWQMLLLGLPCVALFAMSFCALARSVQLFQNQDTYFVDKVYRCFHMVWESIVLALPICHWPKKAELAKYFNAWNRLQARWPRVTGAPLRLEFFGGWGQLFVSSFIVLYSAVVVAVQYYMSDDLDAWKMPLFTAVVLQVNSLSFLWIVLSIHVCNVSRKLRRHFRREMQSGSLATETVQEYGLLWMRARELYLAALGPWESAMMHWLLSAWGMSLLCLFVCLGALLTGEVRRVVSMSGVVGNELCVICIVCYMAEKAEQDVRRGLRLELLRYPVHKLSPRCADEIAHILRLMKNEKNELTLRGSVAVNNGLPVALIKLTVTYLVVLVQFAISLEMMERRQQ